MIYRNQPTVNVVLIDVADKGLVSVRRADNGGWALPGGFQEIPESIREAAAREVREETRIVLEPNALILHDAQTTPDGARNLVFWRAYIGFGTWMDASAEFKPNDEILDITTYDRPWTTPFDIHTKIIEDYFKSC